MASLTSSPTTTTTTTITATPAPVDDDNNNNSPPPVPSRDTESYKRSSQRSMKRELVRQRTEDNQLDLDLETLHITSVEESGVDDYDEGRNSQKGSQQGETKTKTKTTSSATGGHRMRLASQKSLAEFQSVDDAINHAVDEGVTLPEAFQQLSYRKSQVQIINEGILRRSSPNGTISNPDMALAVDTSHSQAVSTSCISSSRPKKTKRTKNKISAITSSPPIIATNISSPSAVKHQMHVKFNFDLCRYDGLSEAAAKGGANQQYGVSLATVPKCQVEGYDARIPAILILLWKKVLENEGEKCMGIFRLAANADEMNWVKKQLNTGEYDGSAIEENIAATMIKIFFRELPTNLLNHVERPLIDKIAGYDNMLSEKPDKKVAIEVFTKLQNGMKEPQYSLLMWLLDIMCQVVVHKEINKMSAKNMAIVVAPNLYSIIDMSNPMAAMTWTQRIARFTEVVLNARMVASPPTK